MAKICPLLPPFSQTINETRDCAGEGCQLWDIGVTTVSCGAIIAAGCGLIRREDRRV